MLRRRDGQQEYTRNRSRAGSAAWSIGLALSVLVAGVAWARHDPINARRWAIWTAQQYYAIDDPSKHFPACPVGCGTPTETPLAPDELITALSSAFTRHQVNVIERAPVDLDRSPGFVHEPVDHPLFVEFENRSRPLTRGCDDPFSLARSLREVARLGPSTTDRDPNPSECLDRILANRPVNAIELSTTFVSLCLTKGIVARRVDLSTAGTSWDHAGVEFYSPPDGQWIFVDVALNLAYQRSGRWLSALDLQTVWNRWKTDQPVLPSTRINRPDDGSEWSRVDVDPVILGPAGEFERSLAGFERRLRAFEYVVYPWRNDFIVNRYPIAHPKKVRRLGLLASDSTPAHPPICPELTTEGARPIVRRAVGRCRIDVLSVVRGENGVIADIQLVTDMPSFHRFERRVDQSAWETVTLDRCTWHLAPGERTLAVRGVNTFGRQGEETTLKIIIEPMNLSEPLLESRPLLSLHDASPNS